LRSDPHDREATHHSGAAGEPRKMHSFVWPSRCALGHAPARANRDPSGFLALAGLAAL
jgi:hypothetical protein